MQAKSTVFMSRLPELISHATTAGACEFSLRTSAAACFSALAAVFPQVIRQRAQRGVRRRVIMEGTLIAAAQEPRVEQPFQVMAQCGSGHLQMALDLAGGGATLSVLDDE